MTIREARKVIKSIIAETEVLEALMMLLDDQRRLLGNAHEKSFANSGDVLKDIAMRVERSGGAIALSDFATYLQSLRISEETETENDSNQA